MSNPVPVTAAGVHVNAILQQRQDALSLDRALFAAAVKEIAREAGGPIRVDVRPLRADPSIVALRNTDAIPGSRDSPAVFAVFASTDSSILATRRALLRRIDLEETDAIEDAQCPGASLPGSPDVHARRLAKCPLTDPFRSLLVALPREGGPYWPPYVDERLDFMGRNAYTVRVLIRMMARTGSVETSRDLVFERIPLGTWQVVRMRSLLIVE